MNLGFDSLADKVNAFNKLGWGLGDDDFDDLELERRKENRSFFKARSASHTTPRQQRSPTQDQVQDQTASVNDKQEQQQRQPRKKPQTHSLMKRVSSAPTPLQRRTTKIIKGTPVGAVTHGSRLSNALQGGAPESSDMEEVAIPESARPAVKAIRRSDSTPVAGTRKRLQARVELGLTADTPNGVGGLPKKKRRREASIVMRDEADQIFKGLAFYYVPDNDIAPARRIRICKAREHGVTWTRSAATATHIVVDRGIRYSEVERLSTGNSRRIVVNEDYPIDCIQFKTVLNHRQKKYQLDGQPLLDTESSIAVAQPLPSSTNSTTAPSLQLKPPEANPRKWDYVPPGATPERTSGEPSQVSRVAGTPIVLDSQSITLDLGRTGTSSSRGLLLQAGNRANEDQQAPETGEIDDGSKSTPYLASPNDELSEYISLMHDYKDVPLDADEEDDGKSTTYSDTHSGSDAEGGSDEEHAPKKCSRKDPRTGQKDMDYTDNFACHRAGTKSATSDNPNMRTIEVLQKMATYYDRVNDSWRTIAYHKAISTLKRQEVKITTEEQAFRLPSVGRRLAQKIEEIATTDRLQRLEYAEMDPRSEALQLFLGIYGVGTAQAQQWIAQGFHTLDDLRSKAKLTTNQLVGIDHYDDLNTKIPRREVEALGAVVKKTAAQIDPEVELVIGGSYRRGAQSSSDIDFIVTKRNTVSSLDLRPFLDMLVQRLEAVGFLVARLASGRPGSDGSKWHGCCVLPKTRGVNEENYRPVWRRIDFLVVPETEMGAALIYFTGNDIFNRSIRLLASKRGMRLNQRGLYKNVMRGPGRVKMTEGELLEGRDEKKIFDILGVKWREPHERWC